MRCCSLWTNAVRARFWTTSPPCRVAIMSSLATPRRTRHYTILGLRARWAPARTSARRAGATRCRWLVFAPVSRRSNGKQRSGPRLPVRSPCRRWDHPRLWRMLTMCYNRLTSPPDGYDPQILIQLVLARDPLPPRSVSRRDRGNRPRCLSVLIPIARVVARLRDWSGARAPRGTGLYVLRGDVRRRTSERGGVWRCLPRRVGARVSLARKERSLPNREYELTTVGGDDATTASPECGRAPPP